MKTNCILRSTLGAAAAWLVAALGSSPVSAQTTNYNFSPFAGGGVVLDHTDGTSARLLNPVGVAVDASGNVFIADAGDHTVREMTGGSVRTIAGSSGVAGLTAGHFIYPFAVTVDASGNVYVADMGANNIKLITPGGSVTTIAGSATGKAGSADGLGTAATFNGPEGIAVDGLGNLYVSDTNNSTIRKIILATGQVSTFAGSAGATGGDDGAGGAARFNFPGNLAVDIHNNVYVADYANSTIRMITPAGQVSTLAGTAGATGTLDGVGGAARFDHPNGVSVDAAGNVYVVDTSNQTIRKIAVGGSVTTVAGTLGIGGRADGQGLTATFFYPQAIAATAAGTLYVADTGNHSLRSISTTFQVGTAAGGAGTIGTFKYPYGAAVDGSGNVYVADQGENVIRKISAGGSVSILAGTGVVGSADGAVGAATFNGPAAVAVDAAGNVYVADTGNSTIRKISAGVVSTIAGAAASQGSADGAGLSARFNRPQGIAIDASGNLWVADTGNDTIREITLAPTVQVSTFAGSAGQQGSADNTRGSARFFNPTGIAVDTVGNVYVSDFSNNTIRKITTGGNVTTLAGFPGVAGDADGPGVAAAFNQPSQIAVDSGGNVYVADTYNRAIRAVSIGGQVTTVTGSQARFLYPQGIAIDSSGNLYVVDGDNQEVDKGAPVVVTQPGTAMISNHTVAVGGSTTFTIGATTPGATYQWQVAAAGTSNFVNIAGATAGSYTVSGATAAMNGNQYRLVISGSATPAATLYVGPARLINLSSRANVSPNNPVVAGFFVGGSGSKQVLIRGIGPTLGTFGVSPVIPDPTLTLFAQTGSAQIATNTRWGGSAQLSNAMSAVFAFALPATSADSALLQTLSVSGNTGYSAQVSSGSNATGGTLEEIYDMDTTGSPSARLINISTKALVGGDSANVLVSGFVITGTTNETILIRGDGPALASLGVQGVLSAPVLSLYSQSNTSTPIATNAGWGNNNAIATAAASVNAFALPTGSMDSAILVSLAPGSYSVQVTGNGGASGTALLEIYEVQ